MHYYLNIQYGRSTNLDESESRTWALDFLRALGEVPAAKTFQQCIKVIISYIQSLVSINIPSLCSFIDAKDRMHHFVPAHGIRIQQGKALRLVNSVRECRYKC